MKHRFSTDKKSAATIYRHLLGMLSILLFLCIASPSAHAMKRNIENSKETAKKKAKPSDHRIENMGEPIVIRKGYVGKKSDVFYIYDAKSDARVQEEGHNRDWTFIYSRDPKFFETKNLDWNQAAPATPPNADGLLDLKSFFQPPHESGYYIFRTAKRSLLKVFAPGINTFTAFQDRLEIPDDGYVEFLLTTVLETRGEGTVEYQIENYVPGEISVQYRDNNIEIKDDGTFTVSGDKEIALRLRSKTPGFLKIHASYGISKKMLELAIVPPNGRKIFVLKNANDSNNDNVADWKSTDPTHVDDPDLVKLDLLDPARTMPLEMRELLNEPGQAELILKLPKLLKFYNSARKAPIPVNFLREDDAHLFYKLDLTPEKYDATLQILQNLYIEGHHASPTPYSDRIILEIKSGEKLLTAAWSVVTLHLFINRTIPPEYYRLNSGYRAPIIKNPAIISIIAPYIFELQSSNIAVLEKFRDQIEWTIAPRTPDYTGVADPLSRFGLRLQLYGIVSGRVKIGVRLRNTGTDYLHFDTRVSSNKNIPVAFQFFTDSFAGRPKAEIQKMADQLPDLLESMNAIMLQTGIQFHNYDLSQNRPYFYFRNKLQAIIDRKIDPLGWVSSTPVLSPLTGKNRYRLQQDGILHDWIGTVTGNQLLDENLAGQKKFLIQTVPPPPNEQLLHHPVILQPDLGDPIIPEKIPQNLDNKESMLYKNVTEWALNEGWPYTMAISSVPNTITFNFLYSGSIREGELGAVNGPAYPSPQEIFTEAGPVNISFQPTSHQFQALFERLANPEPVDPLAPVEPPLIIPPLATAILSLPNFHNDEKPIFIPQYAKKLLTLALRTLGLKERSIDGDLDHYKDQAALDNALSRKILLRDGQNIIINPITPATDHESAIINFHDDILTVNPQGERGNRIDHARAAILHVHPFLQY